MTARTRRRLVAAPYTVTSAVRTAVLDAITNDLSITRDEFKAFLPMYYGHCLSEPIVTTLVATPLPCRHPRRR